MAHGFIRATDDLDLLAQASRRKDWNHFMEGLGFTLYREARSFLQFNPPPDARLPVDIMFVADPGFEKMRAASEPADVGGISFGVVSLLHLIALKCHAIKNGKEFRKIKDTDDLIHLIRLNGLDLNEPELRGIVLEHGNQELYEKLQRACAPD